MNWIALICLGASDGARVENLLESATRLLALPQARALRACSELFGDRHRPHRGGATVNLMLALEVEAGLTIEALEHEFKRIEAAFGRQRDPRRAMPVPLDIDLLGRIGDGVQWQPRYDPGRAYLYHGLHQLPLPVLQRELDRVVAQRGFAAEQNASGFYGLASAAFVERYLAASATRPSMQTEMQR
ncbi:2-amino-4-hydroxy-6-hydroxymethyldihydropteridine diphosphokinase [Lysobacter capsici]|uniref:2-amino-4-hydroxy-6- hydroxymethyldihydropteridine diphosphokinase n=1 Tax=Lysobacter capsici TaxID=435897 RepID=UPI001C003CCA|nr:2-amino-4-hydroxy-6-hydroxymethyldihydropteridine diphosphokinase [Lysobacter capsici]QWF19075.1 2-amino-4-hydroxy-6-hydroxymethyldihydropteridine diphosphokinase [Lysobacter capsici]